MSTPHSGQRTSHALTAATYRARPYTAGRSPRTPAWPGWGRAAPTSPRPCQRPAGCRSASSRSAAAAGTAPSLWSVLAARTAHPVPASWQHLDRRVRRLGMAAHAGRVRRISRQGDGLGEGLAPAPGEHPPASLTGRPAADAAALADTLELDCRRLAGAHRRTPKPRQSRTHQPPELVTPARPRLVRTVTRTRRGVTVMRDRSSRPRLGPRPDQYGLTARPGEPLAELRQHGRPAPAPTG